MFQEIRILALGERDAVRLCANVLEQAGATLEYAAVRPLGTTEEYDAVVVSSDHLSAPARTQLAALEAAKDILFCDITTFGGCRAGRDEALSDNQIQALSGLMDTTGSPGGAPVPIGVPFAEISAGMYAAAAVAAALYTGGSEKRAQRIDVSVYACAVNALTTFLPKAFSRTRAERVANRHTSAAPWNSYRSRDGRVLICTSTEEHWRKMKDMIGDARLQSERFGSLADRVANVDELDAIIETWTVHLSTAECSSACAATGIPAGPIVPLASLHEERNFRLRHPNAALEIETHGLSRERFRDVSIFRLESACRTAAAPSPIDQARGGGGPLSGLRVVEIGQYTTAPLAGKHLAALGAEVVKIEPPDGEISRTWLPGQRGMSYFFALNNTDKTTVPLDLTNPGDRDYLRRLLTDADVLLENLRPGALAKLGFSRGALEEINPSLIYCSISGFGTTTSAYPARPAFDTVIQAMSGIMDLTRDQDDTPVKTGPSAADILDGQAALFAIIAAVCARPHSGRTFVEVAMQDVAAWTAIFTAGNPQPRGIAVRCADGHVFIDRYAHAGRHRQLIEQCAGLNRAQAVNVLAATDLRAVRVMKVDELMDDANFLTATLGAARDNDGVFWPVVKLPYCFSRTPAVIRRMPGYPADLQSSAKEQAV